MKLQFILNGENVTVEAPPLSRFLDVVREDFGLTATKEGCGEGECGSCSILVDGKVVNSCLLPMVQVDGCQVETLESVVDQEGALSNLQEAFLTADGAQCGICTPGMIMAGTAYLRQIQQEGRGADPQSARVAIAGNLCRCTGYGKIIESIMLAAAEQSEGERP